MELFIIILVLVNLGSLRMIQFLKHKEISEEKIEKWELSFVLLSSLLGGALGVILGIFSLDFKKTDRKFLFINVFFLLMNIIFIKLVIGG